MMSYQFLVVIQCISIVLLCLESIYVFYKWQTKLQAYLFLFCIATLVNNLGYLLEMLAKTSEAALFSTQFCYLGKVLIPLSFFLFIVNYTKTKLPKQLFLVLTFVHMMIFVLVLTCNYQQLYYTDYYFTESGLFPHNVFHHGIMYWVFTVLMFLYSIYAVCILLPAVRKEKVRNKRIQAIYLLVLVLVEFIGYVIFLSGITRGYDTTALAYMICTLLMYIVIFRYNLLDTLDLAKNYTMDNLAEGIIVTSADGDILYYNHPLLEIYPEIETNQDAILVSLQSLIADDAILEINDRVYRPQIQQLFQEHILRGQIYVLTDVTESFRYTMELKEQKEIAEQANASKSRFLSVVSHEIRTPMNAVVGMTDLLLREPEHLTPTQETYLRNIRSSGASLVMIINDILDLSKIEAGKMEIVDQPYNLRDVAEDVRVIIENRIGDKPIALCVSIDVSIPDLLIGDGLRLRQIFINLLNNAVKFTEKGSIRFTVAVVDEDEDGYLLRFDVRDTGQGIRQEDMHRLFEAFSQVNQEANHAKEGTGLGLTISSDFIALMGGQLSVESTFGKGSDFYFTIRQGRVPEEKEPVSSPSAPCTSPENFTAPSAQILIVDDTALNLVMMEKLLEPLCMTIDTVTSGDQALSMVTEKPYDLVFMDYMMPYLDGVQTTQRIRALAETAETPEQKHYYQTLPIIALSGDTTPEAQEQFRQAGMQAFSEKPVLYANLIALLRTWLPVEKMIPS
jgi:signal transduction histidine kinase